MSIQFTLWQAVPPRKNVKNVDVEWQPVGDLPDETFIEEIEVTTTAEKLLNEVGDTPVLMSLGANARECRIKGSFMDSEKFDASYVLNQTLTDSIHVYDGFILPRAISVKEGHDYVPELGSGKWKINTFTWNRDVTTAGRYLFEMTLGYVWQHPAELQIYDPSVATDKPQDVRFFVVPLTTSPASISPRSLDYKEVSAIRVEKSVNKENTAKFNFTASTISFPTYSPIAIYCTSDESIPVFYGYVYEVITNKDLSQTYNCKEIGSLLYDIPIKSFLGGIFIPRVRIPNPIEKGRFLKLSEIVNGIMTFFRPHKYATFYDPGSGVEKGLVEYSESIYVPGRLGVTFPPQMLSGVSIGKALDNFIQNQCGMNTWFHVKSGELQYGFCNNVVAVDSTREFIESSTIQYTNNDRTANPDYVVIWNSDCTACAVHGMDTESATVTGIAYVMNSTLLDREMKLIAQKVYEDLKTDQSLYKVRFPAGTIRFQEGDVFSGLGDQTSYPVMPYRSGTDLSQLDTPKDSVWQIRDIIITPEATDVIVGTSYRSIFDIYRSDLSKRDEVPSPTEIKKWSSNTIYTNAGES